jgi:hypothetical protein
MRRAWAAIAGRTNARNALSRTRAAILLRRKWQLKSHTCVYRSIRGVFPFVQLREKNLAALVRVTSVTVDCCASSRYHATRKWNIIDVSPGGALSAKGVAIPRPPPPRLVVGETTARSKGEIRISYPLAQPSQRRRQRRFPRLSSRGILAWVADITDFYTPTKRV